MTLANLTILCLICVWQLSRHSFCYAGNLNTCITGNVQWLNFQTGKIIHNFIWFPWPLKGDKSEIDGISGLLLAFSKCEWSPTWSKKTCKTKWATLWNQIWFWNSNLAYSIAQLSRWAYITFFWKKKPHSFNNCEWNKKSRIKPDCRHR